MNRLYGCLLRCSKIRCGECDGPDCKSAHSHKKSQQRIPLFLINQTIYLLSSGRQVRQLLKHVNRENAIKISVRKPVQGLLAFMNNRLHISKTLMNDFHDSEWRKSFGPLVTHFYTPSASGYLLSLTIQDKMSCL
jgi:hypothetical protein